LNSFCNYTPQTIFDPRVAYDKIWNRWVVTAEAFPESASTQIVCLAISTTSDATGSFFLYKFNAPRGTASNFYDYPMLGMDQDAVLISANIFDSADNYLFSEVTGAAKAKLYNGLATTLRTRSAGASNTLAVPIVETDDSAALILSRAGSGSTIALRRATNMQNAAAALSAATNITVPAFTASSSAAQPNSTQGLDVLNRFQDHSTQISNHVLNITTVGGSIPTPRWMQFNGNNNTLAASGNVFESGSSHDFNPAVAGSSIGGTAANPIGRMFFTWTATRPTSTGGHFARVKASGRLATDATTITGGSTLGTSTIAYNPSADTVERWGDYSSVTIDPTAVTGCPVGNRSYIVNEWNSSSATLWSSRFGRLGFC
jgi:hypothetical protein